MTGIAHLSDVHFGRHDPAAVTAVLDDLASTQPELVVISGDLTQRARTSEFRAAREFLRAVDELGLRWLAVPGNHDIALYNIARRFVAPLGRYQRYITPDLSPHFRAPRVAVLGLNTARSLTISDGRVSREQIAALADGFAGVAADALRVLVTHHPLVALPWGAGGTTLAAAGRSGLALDAARAARVDMLLAGHHHRSFAGAGDSCCHTHGGILVVQAGTATSTRLRNERNSYNRIRIEGGTVEIEVRVRDTGPFQTGRVECHRRVDGAWTAASGVRSAAPAP